MRIYVLHINIPNINLLLYVDLCWLTYNLFFTSRSSIHTQFWCLLKFVVRWKKQSFFVVFHLRHFWWHSLTSLGIHNRRSIGRCDVHGITGFCCIIGIFLCVYFSIMLSFLMSITTWKFGEKKYIDIIREEPQSIIYVVLCFYIAQFTFTTTIKMHIKRNNSYTSVTM